MPIDRPTQLIKMIVEFLVKHSKGNKDHPYILYTINQFHFWYYFSENRLDQQSIANHMLTEIQRSKPSNRKMEITLSMNIVYIYIYIHAELNNNS